MVVSSNFFEMVFELFYFFLRVSQVFYDFLTYKVELSFGSINLGLFEIPLGLDISFYPSAVLGGQLFISLMILRFIKKFVPLA